MRQIMSFTLHTLLYTLYFRPNGTIYVPNSKKSSERDFNGRLSCRTKAKSIPGGRGLKMALGAKLKKLRKFFLRSLTECIVFLYKIVRQLKIRPIVRQMALCTHMQTLFFKRPRLNIPHCIN